MHLLKNASAKIERDALNAAVLARRALPIWRETVVCYCLPSMSRSLTVMMSSRLPPPLPALLPQASHISLMIQVQKLTHLLAFAKRRLTTPLAARRHRLRRRVVASAESCCHSPTDVRAVRTSSVTTINKNQHRAPWPCLFRGQLTLIIEDLRDDLKRRLSSRLSIPSRGSWMAAGASGLTN